MQYEYRVHNTQEVWLFFADGGGERFAVMQGPNGAELVARLLNENLARIENAKAEVTLIGKCIDQLKNGS